MGPNIKALIKYWEERVTDEKTKKKNFTITQNEIMRCNLISTEARFLYAVLCSYNPSFPSYKNLHEVTGWWKDRISKYLKELVERKIITYTKGNSRKRANQYYINPIAMCDLTSPKIGPVKKEKKILTSPKIGPVLATTSPEIGLQLVRKSDSNNTKEKNQKNPNKINEGKMTKFKLLKNHGVIKEFLEIENKLTLEILECISHRVQNNWLDLYKHHGDDWVRKELAKAVAFYVAKETKNYALALTNWLRIANDNPEWGKKLRLEEVPEDFDFGKF